MEENVLLRMEGICKSFPGVKALDNAQLSVRAGTVHALMGENGAGKSTLMKCLFGIYSKDAGHIYLDGKEIDFKSSREALDNGVAMVHQELNQALKRTVMDNIWLGRYPLVKKGLPFVSDKQSYNDTKKVFDDLGINVNPRTVMSTMPVSQRQMVEIAKAVSFNSKVIVFDEPTSSLTETEVEHLFRIINMLKQRGCGIVYISHKMEEILRISDDVTIMRDGQWVATRPAKELTMDEIIRLMVGRPLTNRFPPKDNVVGDEDILKVEGLTAEYSHLKDANIHVRKGEILGVAGLDSSGRTELLENIFGSATRKSGKIYKNGKLVGNKTPRESIKNGFALVTEERRATGILGILDIRANTVIASLKKYLNGPFLSDKKMAEATNSMIKAMRIKTPSQQTKINTQAIVAEGQSLLIGGYYFETQSDNDSGIPALKNIPILGGLFGTTGKKHQRMERLILITPRIVRMDKAPEIPIRVDDPRFSRTPTQADYTERAPLARPVGGCARRAELAPATPVPLMVAPKPAAMPVTSPMPSVGGKQ